MSIIHEALKKATRENIPGGTAKPQRSFSLSSSVSVQSNQRRFAAALALIGLAILIYQGRGTIGGIFQTREAGQETTRRPPASPSVILPAPEGGNLPEDIPAVESGPPILSGADHERQGIEHYQQGQYPEAERELSIAAELNPGSSLIQNNIGLVLKAQGRQKEAEARYQAALRIDSGNVHALNNLGLLYDQQNRIEEAKRLYQKAISSRPDFPDAHLNYAVLLERAGYLEEAKRQYRSFLSVASRDQRQAVEMVRKHLRRMP